ncbi:ABC transporter permease [Deinococcus detaillensis]|uniref:ABC transporter permease n=1 Tax=Deinococcus detaillensis TaxID=2592048 RepID=A0A553UIC2_9DEIO|nr:ABC transporter permease [Deinococcus detaillensis]TSA79943.1 ABC transporter permease [Deinococcus detaillensis]
MKSFLHWGAGIVLALHGLIHLLGFVAYLRLATVATLPYKTTFLSGRLDLGVAGTSVFGLAWGVAALRFVLVAAAFFLHWDWWRPALIAVTLLSLVLTVLDVGVAFAGVAVNIMILLALWFGSRRGSTFSRSKFPA